MERVETDAVDKLGRALDIPDSEVGGFSGLQRAGFRKQAQRLGGIACRRRQALFHGHVEKRGTHIHGQEQRGER